MKLAQVDFNFGDLENASGSTFAGGQIGDIIFASFNYIFFFAGVLLLLYLLLGGFQLMLSQGDPKAVEMGRAKISNSLVGFLVIFLAYFLVQVTGRFLGIEAITDIFG